MTEAQIIKGCRKGKAACQRALVERYSGKLLAICQRYVGRGPQAQDVLQEAFIHIFRNIKKYRHTGSFEAWMCRIAVTTSLKELRDNWKVRQLEDLDKWTEQSDATPQVLQDMAAEDILKLIEEHLPLHYRVIFHLFVVEGYSHAEISELLGIPESTSRTKLTRARKHLQELFSMNDILLGEIKTRG